MQMLYTSGTTGDPKAILSPHARFAVGKVAGEMIGINGEDRPYTGLSLTHANAQFVTLGCTLHMGLRGVISREFTKSRLWDITRRYGCTWFNLLGGMTTAIYAMPEREDDSDNPVRIVLSAGMPAAIWGKFARRFGVEIAEFYGAAEGGLTFNRPGEGPVGSCGKAPPTLQMSILGDQDEECGPGQLGEICFRNADGTTPVVKYFKKPEASAEKIRDGWLRMGDIGRVDEAGWLYFHHRKGGGLRRNGDFVDIARIERTLAEMPEVDDVFIYGVPAANGVPGEKDIVAAIVLASNGEQQQVCQQIVAGCRRELPSNSAPSYLHLITSIPKTASEKPIERFLLEDFDPDSQRVIRC
jgi:crotonobetaine/carnitine-CoA ligase